MLDMDRDEKVSTVTPSYDLPFRGQRSKKVKILNYFKGQKYKCQHVGHGQTCKSVHGDLVVQPTVKGSKVKDGQNFKVSQMAKITVSTCWTWTDMQKCPQ